MSTRTKATRLPLAATLLLALSCSGAEKKPDPAPAPAAAPETAAAPEATATAASAEAGPRRAPWDRSPVDDWSTPPAPGPEPSFLPPRPTSFTLRSGLRVIVLPRHALPLVSIRVVVRGAGAAADPAKAPGLAAYVADLVDEGAGRRSALEIAAEVERLGATLSTYAGADHAYLSMDALASTFEPAFSLLAAVLSRPTFDPKEARRVRDERVDTLETRRDRPREVASLLLGRSLYGPGSAYGHPVAGYARSARTFDAKKARAFWKKRWRPEATVIVVAGDVDPASVKKLVRTRLARFKQKGRKQKIRAPKVRPIEGAPRLVLADRPGAPQSEVRAGLVGIARGDARWPAFEVLTTLLGGGFTSRLNHRLREELGYTYGVRAAQVPRSGAGPFVIASALHTPKTADAAREILRMVGELSTTEVPEEELEKARQNLVRALPERFETNAACAETFAELAAFGLPLSWYDGYQAAVRAVDAGALKRLAGELLPSGGLRFAVVGDASVIEAGLSEILGPASRVDAEGNPQPR